MKTLHLLIITFFLAINLSFSQDTIIPLWPDKIPFRIDADEEEIHEQNGILRISKVQEPTIEVYLPSKAQATGQAVLIFPGGGYYILAYDWEGTDIAKMLNTKGIAGIVVKNRLPTSNAMEQNHLVPLTDAQRALKLVKSMATDFNLDPDKIGIMGFSAGGHLTASLGTHFDETLFEPTDEIDRMQVQPNFMVLMYPVIQFDSDFSHLGSQKALLGENPDDKWLNYFSLEKQVKDNTPPTIFFHASDDTAVPVENSLSMYSALREKDIKASLHVFPKGGHGFGLGLQKPLVKEWPTLLTDWILNLDVTNE